MLEQFKGRGAVVTGGARGIGRALTLALAEAGLSVAILDVDEAAGAETADAAQKRGVEALAVRCDVSLPDDLDHAYKEVERALGVPGLLWANTGVGAMGGVLSNPDENLDWVYGVNVLGMARTLRRFVGPMREAGRPGHVGITASVAGLTPIRSYAALYGASKFGVIGLAEALRAELGEANDPIGVTVLCPGLVATRIWDAGRARPERFGGATSLPEEVGQRWREEGMDPAWIARVALERADAGGGYVTPVDPHSKDDLQARHDMLLRSMVYPDQD